MNSDVSPPAVQFDFAGFRLDATRRRLQRVDGSLVTLTPRQFSALQLFAEHPGELLEKERLLTALWPRVVVEENSLSQLISALRRALGDDGRSFIQTEPRQGFRFVAQVTPRLADSTAAVPRAAGRTTNATLAVLPFVSLGGDGHDDLLEIGMADSLIARLSSMPGLVVRSIGSVRRFAGRTQDALEAARALEVDWIIDGSIQRDADRLRVTARLLSLPDGHAGWSGHFDESLKSLFDLQDTLADRVAEALARHLTLPRSESSTPAGGGTRSVEAYQHYLAGLAHLQGVLGHQLRRSATEFEHAIAIDPDYALAIVGKAEAHRRMVFGADSAPAEVLAPSRQWLLQALAVAPGLAEAHCQLAHVVYWYDYDWAAAARGFRQALALKPSLAHAHFGLGFLLTSLGRIDDGMHHMHAACELDPMGLVYNLHYACFLAHRGEREAGRARLQWVLEVAPDFWVGYLALGRMGLIDGDFDAAIAAARHADRLCDGQSTQAAAMLGAACARAGRHDEARAILAVLEQRSRERFMPPTSPATVLAALGERERALALLERGFEVRDTRLVYIKDDWRWDGLRAESRYRALLQLMKLDGYGPGLVGT